MKNNLLVLAAVLLSATTYAQKNNHSISQKPTKEAVMKAILNNNANELQPTSVNKATKEGLDSIVYSSYEENVGKWIINAKQYYVYNGLGRPTSGEYYYDQSGSGNLSKMEKVLYLHDLKGNLKSETYSEWDDMAQKWEISYRSTYTYNPTHNTLVGFLYDEWNSSSMQWDNNFKVESEINSNGDLTSTNNFDWDGSAWERTSSTTYTYDSKNRLEQTIDSFKSNSSGDWYAQSRTDFKYDGSDNNIERESFWYDQGTNQWKMEFLVTNTFDSKGNLTLEDEKEYNTDNSQYENSYQSVYGYDANGNPTSEHYLDYEDLTGKWDSSAWYAYTYNLSKTVDPYLLKIDVFVPDFTEKITNQPVDQIYYEGDGSGGWDMSDREQYYFSTKTFVGVLPVNVLTGATIYPNPASNHFYVKGIENNAAVKVNITNLSGNTVYQNEVNSNDAISTSNLSAGIYVVKIESNGAQFVTKLVIQ